MVHLWFSFIIGFNCESVFVDSLRNGGSDFAGLRRANKLISKCFLLSFHSPPSNITLFLLFLQGSIITVKVGLSLSCLLPLFLSRSLSSHISHFTIYSKNTHVETLLVVIKMRDLPLYIWKPCPYIPLGSCHLSYIQWYGVF